MPYFLPLLVLWCSLGFQWFPALARLHFFLNIENRIDNPGGPPTGAMYEPHGAGVNLMPHACRILQF